jgi:pimeloyl-ACP methyl ester carboxylesterase
VRHLLLVAALAAVAVSAACGSSGGTSGGDEAPLAQAGPIGGGADMVWYYRASGKPRSVVVFLHGYGGAREETPANHVAWLKHLAAAGSDVIYPRYEVGGLPDPFPHLEAGVEEAMRRLGNPDLPTIVIGYSRGARIGIDYAALEAARGREPEAVLAVFPGLNAPGERLGPLDRLDSKLKIVLMVGDHDTSVGSVGARAILARLAQVRFPPEQISVVGVRSNARFSATHLSVLEATPGAKAAIWKPADRLIESVR